MIPFPHLGSDACYMEIAAYSGESKSSSCIVFECNARAHANI